MKFQGDWENDYMKGVGIVFFAYGGSLFGHFIKNKIHGPGIAKLPNGDVYAGSWQKGKLHGNCSRYLSKKRKFSID